MFVDNPNVVSLEEESPEKEMRELVEIGEIENHFFAVRMCCEPPLRRDRVHTALRSKLLMMVKMNDDVAYFLCFWSNGRVR